MQIEKTVLKKGLIISGISAVCLLGSGGMIYIINSYGKVQEHPVSKSLNNQELPDGKSVSFTINNILNAIPAKEQPPAIESVPIVVPDIDVRQREALQINQFVNQQIPDNSDGINMRQSLVQNKHPKMLVVSSNSLNITDSHNDISGTNTAIGVGEINANLQVQRSPYTVFAGTFIPATMVTGLNSDNNGEIVAIVRNDVYDSTNGKYLLIPQGARLVGTYNHDVAYGQNRLIVGWNRLIYPNGSSFLLHGQPGTDLQGASGLSGDVDNHWDKRLGASAIIGLIFGGMTLATGSQATNPYQLSAGATIASQVGAQMSQTGIQVINKGMNIAPTIIINPGYKFNILTTADLVLKPYIYNQTTTLR